MSLHTLANHLQQAGRGEDKVLVHMTPKEVSGLQSLAMAHGGSLTVNPKTGLPEAGFLSSILPMVAGFALGPAGMGLSAMQAGLAAGAIGTVATGSLQKGLMAGLGAFGGAGLSASLAGIGPAAATSGLGAANAASALAPAGAPFTMPTAGAMAATPATAASLPTATGAAAGTPSGMPAPANPAVTPQITMPEPAPPTNINVPGTNTFTDRMKNIGQNVGKLFGSSNEDKQYTKQFLNQNKPELISSGLSLMAYRPDIEMPKEHSKKFDPNYRAYSPGYFDPMYASAAAPSSTADRRYFVKNGGLLALAEGGAIEQMSKFNAIGANTGYPMSDQSMSKYSVASANPVSENIIKPQGDSNVDPYTGEEKFANGGGLGSVYQNSGSNKKSDPANKNSDVYTPEYNYRDPVTGQYKYVEPEPTYQALTKVPGLDKNVRRVTADDINIIFARYGLAPSDLQLKQSVGNRLSDQQIFDKFVRRTPEWSQKRPLTADQVNSYFQKVWGQDATPDEVAKFSNPKKKYNVADLYKYAAKQPEYLQNLNKASQTKFTTGQEQKKEQELQTKRETAPIDVKGVASTFQDILGRPPTYDELQSYKGKPLIAEDLKKQLTTTPEYEKNLTKKFIPDIQYDQFGRASIEGLPAYKTPEQQLGLGGFYDMMNQQLAQQGGYKAAPPPPPPMQDRLTPPPAPITYQPPGGVAPPPFAPGEDGRGLPPPPPSFAMPITPPPGSNFGVDPITGLPIQHMADGGYAGGGISHLGDYSDGGRLLKGPGDGVSDSIPASIGDRQPARLADGEFVIPARIVSEIGNGSTDAGARKLYAMMDRIQKVRRKSVGKGKVAVDSKAEKYLPA